MLQQRTATIAAIFSEVLANLAFMFTEEDLPPSPEGDPWMETTIGYRGPACGSLSFLCTRGFARVLAANLLAIDPEDRDADAKAPDAAKEFMNIVCGQLVTTLHGPEQVFDISIPRNRPLNEGPDLMLSPGPESCTLSVEGFPVQLTFLPGVEPDGRRG